MSEPVYIIGIDLGTTNTVAAYAEIPADPGRAPDIRIFRIPQLVDAGVIEKRDLLPSFILVPGPHDLPDGALALPWEEQGTTAAGEFARNRGAEIPHRLISSTKSWLCHTLVDRNAKILPWQGLKDAGKLSPVEASAAILRHIRNAWNHEMAGDETLRMENQEILLTVPASFDAVARELTVQAAAMADLKHVTLLEEPQAAFYAWIDDAGDRWREMVKKGDLILICDVGGGTSDFSLIRVSESGGNLDLERIAVGDHLLVGGDNMDLTLAHAVSLQMAVSGTRLDAWQMNGLWHSCRQAKEKLFSSPDAAEAPVTILGRGSGLIGGMIRRSLTRDQVDQVILDGFFPVCERTEKPGAARKHGIQELGLSYESDPAVTRHLAYFLSRHQTDENAYLSPTAVFFNGGVMKAPSVRRRILEVLNAWRPEDGGLVREIAATDLDLAVARGAAYYGLVRRGQGIRIRGGLGKSYYIEIGASMPAVPGLPAPTKALCVAPFGMEEGTRARVAEQRFVLIVGEPVCFAFLESSLRRKDAVGQTVEDWEAEGIEPLTTLETTLDGEAGTTVPVALEVNVTEIGTLDIWCVCPETGRRWKLEFNVREKGQCLGAS
ncbi:MAG: Hsp70 family protein [Desulfobacterales bacterium]|nr:Hsp70 family protein [Desulfobacterales bacterium]